MISTDEIIEYPELTKAEIAALQWASHEKWALVNKKTKSILLGADTKQACIDDLNKMTSKHPLYPLLQLVERP